MMTANPLCVKLIHTGRRETHTTRNHEGPETMNGTKARITAVVAAITGVLFFWKRKRSEPSDTASDGQF